MTALRSLPPIGRACFERRTDVVVVGAGAAGISTALAAAAGGRRVLLIVKAAIAGGSTPLAQGGLAAALGAEDTPARHAADTVSAGVGLCDEDAVAALVGAAPREVARLAACGARWDEELGREGGHSADRIVHAGGDASGAEVHRVLAAALRESAVEVVEKTVALDALVGAGAAVGGLVVGRVRAGGALEPGLIRARAVVLASGGYARAWATSTNPVGNTGDGLALAVRAGAEAADVEFVQFHPTVLWQPGAAGRRPLVTEALRGAGAVLVDDAGRSVMHGVHPWADLAPRDVVAAAMAARMAETGAPHLWLDATNVGRRRLAAEFPTVTAACRAVGVDPAVDLIPMAPGAHYTCGGVRADMEGATSLAGLFAVGEVAATGLHGANRLASNSLTEALVTGRRLGERLAAELPPELPAELPPELPAEPVEAVSGRGVDPRYRAGLERAMSAHAGVVRDDAGLRALLDHLAAAPPARAGDLDLATVEVTNLHTVATMVAVTAQARTESRGCHRRRDFPDPDPARAHRSVLVVRDGRVELATAVRP